MKYILAFIILSLITIGCYTTGYGVTRLDDDWPMFMHDVHHTGYSPSRITMPLKETWSHEKYGKIEPIIAFNPDYEGIYTQFVISEEKIYILLYPGTIFSLDLNNGSVSWNIQTDESDTVWWSFPAVADQRVFASVGNKIVCLDSDTGNLVWEYEVKFIEFMSSPIVHDKYVYVGSGETGADISSSIWNDAKKIRCLHADTGELRWEFESDFITTTSPAFFNGRIFINGGNKTVYSLDAQTGQLIWKSELENSLTSSISTDGERLFIGDCTGILSCLELETGDILWMLDCGDYIYGTPAVSNNNVYIGTLDGIFYCVDSEHGKSVWTIETGSRIIVSPALADGKVFFGTEDGELYVADSKSGKILDFHDLGDGRICALAISRQKLLLGQENGRIVCFEGSSRYTYLIFMVIIVVLLSGILAYHRMKRS